MRLVVYDNVETCSQGWKKTEEQVWESHYLFTAIGQQMLSEIEMYVPEAKNYPRLLSFHNFKIYRKWSESYNISF